MFANPLYTYNIKPTILLASPSKVDILAISLLNSVLGLEATSTPYISSSPCSTTNASICAYITTIRLSLYFN